MCSRDWVVLVDLKAGASGGKGFAMGHRGAPRQVLTRTLSGPRQGSEIPRLQDSEEIMDMSANPGPAAYGDSRSRLAVPWPRASVSLSVKAGDNILLMDYLVPKAK